MFFCEKSKKSTSRERDSMNMHCGSCHSSVPHEPVETTSKVEGETHGKDAAVAHVLLLRDVLVPVVDPVAQINFALLAVAVLLGEPIAQTL